MNYLSKIISDSQQLVDLLPSISRPLVFTNGCFDILHRGHVDYLWRSASLGRSLIVAVNDDESARKLGKGSERPFNSIDDRIAVLASLECVDYVTSFHEATPLELIHIIKPDHLVKGGDWPKNKIVGGTFVSQLGGKVHSLQFLYKNSTTKLIYRIQSVKTSV